ncbi:MAG TPA: ketopantoate reductase C-terminal domain-containing protein, partial [Dehalococcoidia bacterium]|nr:ketopantoate reductase C-terminal domain-containing protein [Dehalococcoidia bacterium]
GLSALTAGPSQLSSTARTDPAYRAIAHAMRVEAEECIAAAGIDCATRDEYEAEIWSRYKHVDVPGSTRGGTSTWQSLMRGRTSIEVDYLNGEIVLLGALYGVPTPCNATIRRLSQQLAVRGEPVGHYKAGEIAAMLDLEPATA